MSNNLELNLIVDGGLIENNFNIPLSDIPIAKRWINANLIQDLMDREGE